MIHTIGKKTKEKINYKNKERKTIIFLRNINILKLFYLKLFYPFSFYIIICILLIFFLYFIICTCKTLLETAVSMSWWCSDAAWIKVESELIYMIDCKGGKWDGF